MNITDPEVVQYLQEIAALKSDRDLKELEEFAVSRFIPIIHKEALEVLLYFIATEKPWRILELGTAIGYSAIRMARQDESIQIDSIERDTEMVRLAEENIRGFDLSGRIRVIQGEAEEVMEKLAERPQRYDLIFMDAGKSHYSTYLKLALELMTAKGLIICDNVLIRGMVAGSRVEKKHSTAILNMRRFIEEVSLDDRFHSMLLPVGDGLLIIKTKELTHETN